MINQADELSASRQSLAFVRKVDVASTAATTPVSKILLRDLNLNTQAAGSFSGRIPTVSVFRFPDVRSANSSKQRTPDAGFGDGPASDAFVSREFSSLVASAAGCQARFRELELFLHDRREAASSIANSSEFESLLFEGLGLALFGLTVTWPAADALKRIKLQTLVLGEDSAVIFSTPYEIQHRDQYLQKLADFKSQALPFEQGFLGRLSPRLGLLDRSLISKLASIDGMNEFQKKELLLTALSLLLEDVGLAVPVLFASYASSQLDWFNQRSQVKKTGFDLVLIVVEVEIFRYGFKLGLNVRSSPEESHVRPQFDSSFNKHFKGAFEVVAVVGDQKPTPNQIQASRLTLTSFRDSFSTNESKCDPDTSKIFRDSNLTIGHLPFTPRANLPQLLGLSSTPANSSQRSAQTPQLVGGLARGFETSPNRLLKTAKLIDFSKDATAAGSSPSKAQAGLETARNCEQPTRLSEKKQQSDRPRKPLLGRIDDFLSKLEVNTILLRPSFKD